MMHLERPPGQWKVGLESDNMSRFALPLGSCWNEAPSTCGNRPLRSADAAGVAYPFCLLARYFWAVCEIICFVKHVFSRFPDPHRFAIPPFAIPPSVFSRACEEPEVPTQERHSANPARRRVLAFERVGPHTHRLAKRHLGGSESITPPSAPQEGCRSTPNLSTNIVDFRGLDSSTILILRDGILMSMGDCPESLSQAMLVGVMLVGRLGVVPHASSRNILPNTTAWTKHASWFQAISRGIQS